MQFVALVAAVALISCSGQKSTSQEEAAPQSEASYDTIPYLLTHNYFINNDVDSLPEVITSEAEFSKYIGMAAVMGKDGQPTEIDFSTQFIIVAAVAPTDIATEITPVSLAQEDGSLIFTCKITNGEKQTFTIHPFVMVAVDKKYQMPVKIVWQ